SPISSTRESPQFANLPDDYDSVSISDYQEENSESPQLQPSKSLESEVTLGEADSDLKTEAASLFVSLPLISDSAKKIEISQLQFPLLSVEIPLSRQSLPQIDLPSGASALPQIENPSLVQSLFSFDNLKKGDYKLSSENLLSPSQQRISNLEAERRALNKRKGKLQKEQSHLSGDTPLYEEDNDEITKIDKRIEEIEKEIHSETQESVIGKFVTSDGVEYKIKRRIEKNERSLTILFYAKRLEDNVRMGRTYLIIKDGETPYLGIFVEPDFQRKGLGSQLIDVLMKEVHSRGVSKVRGEFMGVYKGEPVDYTGWQAFFDSQWERGSITKPNYHGDVVEFRIAGVESKELESQPKDESVSSETLSSEEIIERIIHLNAAITTARKAGNFEAAAKNRELRAQLADRYRAAYGEDVYLRSLFKPGEIDEHFEPELADDGDYMDDLFSSVGAAAISMQDVIKQIVYNRLGAVKANKLTDNELFVRGNGVTQIHSTMDTVVDYVLNSRTKDQELLSGLGNLVGDNGAEKIEAVRAEVQELRSQTKSESKLVQGLTAILSEGTQIGEATKIPGNQEEGGKEGGITGGDTKSSAQEIPLLRYPWVHVMKMDRLSETLADGVLDPAKRPTGVWLSYGDPEFDRRGLITANGGDVVVFFFKPDIFEQLDLISTANVVSGQEGGYDYLNLLTDNDKRIELGLKPIEVESKNQKVYREAGEEGKAILTTGRLTVTDSVSKLTLLRDAELYYKSFLFRDNVGEFIRSPPGGDIFSVTPVPVVQFFNPSIVEATTDGSVDLAKNVIALGVRKGEDKVRLIKILKDAGYSEINGVPVENAVHVIPTDQGLVISEGVLKEYYSRAGISASPKYNEFVANQELFDKMNMREIILFELKDLFDHHFSEERKGSKINYLKSLEMIIKNPDEWRKEKEDLTLGIVNEGSIKENKNSVWKKLDLMRKGIRISGTTGAGYSVEYNEPLNYLSAGDEFFESVVGWMEEIGQLLADYQNVVAKLQPAAPRHVYTMEDIREAQENNQVGLKRELEKHGVDTYDELLKILNENAKRRDY
ncbi:MAG: GNAT family N-acetyltransferase, partial [Acidobacteriota bacterium]|nr:GNAT family N-acetyltransferase [Acidobacteriota bacterium]